MEETSITAMEGMFLPGRLWTERMLTHQTAIEEATHVLSRVHIVHVVDTRVVEGTTRHAVGIEVVEAVMKGLVVGTADVEGMTVPEAVTEVLAEAVMMGMDHEVKEVVVGMRESRTDGRLVSIMAEKMLADLDRADTIPQATVLEMPSSTSMHTDSRSRTILRGLSVLDWTKATRWRVC